MENAASVRTGWLKAMYLWTLVGAGGFGLAILAMPGKVLAILRFPPQDPVTLKAYGSVLLASGLLAIPALRSPLKFIPLLLLQLVYKPIWIAAVAAPIFLEGRFPLYVVTITGVFLTYIVGNLIAIPFRSFFSKS
ncbi:MAG TPA: hypothetical protein VLJ16_02330 [Acidobacteriota bacterium]|nr:hypothetical protein [Acidobacteriota bacterium]